MVWHVLREKDARLVPESCGSNYATSARVADNEPNIGAVRWGQTPEPLLRGAVPARFLGETRGRVAHQLRRVLGGAREQVSKHVAVAAALAGAARERLERGPAHER